MTPTQVRKVIASLIAEGELPPRDPARLAAELYLRNGLTQRAIGELVGWNTTNVNQWISQWLEGLRNKLVSWDVMKAHGGFAYYYVNPASFGRPEPRPPSAEQQQRAAACRQAHIPRPRRKPKVMPTVRDERRRYAADLLAVWPG